MPTPPTPIPAAVLRAGVFGGWLLFTLMVIAISWTGSLLRGRPADLGGTIVWNLGWLFWAGATFLVARLARRFPLERKTLARGIATHVLFGIGAGVGVLVTEFLVSRALELVWAGAPRANPFLGFIVYKFHVYFLIYWLILGATGAYDFYVKYRTSEVLASQLAARLAEARLQTLQMQLQPHFLFNTHHAIISLMLKHENPAAIRMLTRLSDLLRITLRTTDRQVTSLREELALLDLYLGIQRERYGDRLVLAREVAPAALDAEVPWLLLQPLVENALKHGIDPQSSGGRLSIAVTAEGGQLLLTVRDTGPGFPAGFTLASSAGIGLRNTQERLARIYGERATLTCQASDGGGAEVRVTLPWRTFALAHEVISIAENVPARPLAHARSHQP